MTNLKFVQILILADESVEDSAIQADSRSLATLLLIRDIQVLPIYISMGLCYLHLIAFLVLFSTLLYYFFFLV